MERFVEYVQLQLNLYRAYKHVYSLRLLCSHMSLLNSSLLQLFKELILDNLQKTYHMVLEIRRRVLNFKPIHRKRGSCPA